MYDCQFKRIQRSPTALVFMFSQLISKRWGPRAQLFKLAAPRKQRAPAPNATCQIHPLPALGFASGSGSGRAEGEGEAGEPGGDRRQSRVDAVRAGPFNSRLPSPAAKKIILHVAQPRAGACMALS